MKCIDLSLPLFDKMPVYPGDPEVRIEEIHKLEKEGWNLRQLTITTHLGTHVNAPYHMAKTGQTIDELSLDLFFGKAILYTPQMTFNAFTGIIFHSQNIDQKVAEKIIREKPKFVGLSDQFEMDLTIERKLCEQGIISYENLAHTDLLPNSFMFYGIPLNIKSGDGSPVRAFALVE